MRYIYIFLFIFGSFLTSQNRWIYNNFGNYFSKICKYFGILLILISLIFSYIFANPLIKLTLSIIFNISIILLIIILILLYIKGNKSKKK